MRNIAASIILTCFFGGLLTLHKGPGTWWAQLPSPNTGGGGGGARNNLVFEATFEGAGNEIPGDNTPNTWFYEKTAATSNFSAWSINAENSITAVGSGSVRFELRKTDAKPDAGNSARSELTIQYAAASSFVTEWMGFKIYLPSSGYGTDPMPDIIQQNHASNGESPAFGIGTLNGDWMIEYNHDDLTNVIYTTIDLGIPYEKDQWVSWVYNIKYSAGADGFIHLYKDGVNIWNYSGQTQYNSSGPFSTGGRANFSRIGIYKWPWRENPAASTQSVRIAYYDEVRIGNSLATYSDVAPG